MASLLIGGIMASHALLETARDALFLARLPAERLAWVYLAIAVVSFFLFFLQERKSVRSDRRSLAIWLGGSAGVNVVLWALTAQPDTWTLYVLYTWSGTFASLVVVRLWTLLGDLFSIGEAKRVFSLIGAGGVSGAIVGSLLARGLTGYLDPRHLLLASSVILVATAISTRLLSAPAQAVSNSDPRSDAPSMENPIDAIWNHPYLRRVGGIVLLSAITLTLADFVFKSSVAQFVEPDDLGSFFATTYLVLNTLSLIIQLFAVSWLIRRLSVNRVLSILPTLVGFATAAVVFGGGLFAALAIKGFDGILRHSLHRTAVEVLYVPLSGDIRSKVKGFIDVIGQRGGQAIASVVILIAAAFSQSIVIMSVFVLLLAIAWIAVTVTLERHYLDLFRATLKSVGTRARLEFPDMDLESLETLLTHLNSEENSRVIAALDMFEERDRVHLIPALILYHPSTPVVLRVLELFTLSGRQDFLAILGRLLENSDPEIRAASLHAHTWAFGPRPDLYRELVQDPSPIVGSAALVGLVSYGGDNAEQTARRAIEAFSQSNSPEEGLALARAIRYSPGPIYTDILCNLAASDDTGTKIATIQAMREILSAEFIPTLANMLPVRALRKEARSTLVAIGTEALHYLDRILGDEHSTPELRVHMPRTIGFFPPESATPVLMKHLESCEDGTLVHRILRAVGRARRAQPDIELDETALRNCLERTLRDTFRLIDQRTSLERGAEADASLQTATHQMLVELLRNRHTLSTERLFRFIGLLYPDEDARSLYRGVYNPSPQLRDSSRELLEHVLEAPLQEPVLALVDDVNDESRLDRAGPYHQKKRTLYNETLGNILRNSDPGSVSLVAYHAVEIGAHGLRNDFERLEDSQDQFVQEAIAYALAHLGTTKGATHES